MPSGNRSLAGRRTGSREEIGLGAIRPDDGTLGFGARCPFCGIGLFSVRRDEGRDDSCAPLLFLCPECGAYRLCEAFETFLREKPTRRAGVRKFVTAAALEGFLPRLCVDHQDFEEIASPFIRAWQKCQGCRSSSPSSTSDGRLVHPARAGAPCRAEEEWCELEAMEAGRKG